MNGLVLAAITPATQRPTTRRWAGLTRTLLLALLPAAPALAEDRENCLYCHQYPGLSRLDEQSNRVRLFYIDPAYLHSQRGPHARLACTDCHPRQEVGVVPHHDVTPVDCTRQCHLVSSDRLERRFSHADVARMLDQSTHTREILSTIEFAGGPLLAPQQSQCLYCHDEPIFRGRTALESHRDVEGAAFDRCDVCHASQVPLDTSYMLQHVAARLQTTRDSLELAQVCAVCHSDPKVVGAHDLSDSVASYVRSFHGKAALLGDETTANCLSCHVRSGENAHLMRGKTDPASAVFPENIADGCRSVQCHPGAELTIAATGVHLDIPVARGTIEYGLAFAFIILTIISFGPSAVIVLLELVQVVIGRHAHAARRVEELAEAVLQHPEGRKRLMRFAPRYRWQHWLLTVLFILLCLSGFPLKFADQAWAATMIGGFGGLAAARFIHHWCGVALVVGFLLHLGDILWGVLRRARAVHPDGQPIGLTRAFFQLPFVLTVDDGRRSFQLLGYLFGFHKKRPMFGQFTATEKFEYFGVVWGTMLLGITGLMLWGAEYASHLFGGRVFNLATIIHTYEAFLAVIHVGILHIYNVVLNPAVFPLSLATLSGYTPVTKLAEENGEFVLDVASELGLLPEVATDE